METVDHSPPVNSHPGTFKVTLLKRMWLSKKAFEVELSRPPGFTFRPGQRIRFVHSEYERDYSLISTPNDPTLSLCLRNVEGGRFSPQLALEKIGARFEITGPMGYFTFRASYRRTIFIGTGTGIAPFVSMVRSGTNAFTLLHGVSLPEDLYYESVFRSAAKHYIPCIPKTPSDTSLPKNSFFGRVTGYLETHLPSEAYDFYLCGRSEMIRDVTLLVDDRFTGSYVYTEMFY